MEIKRSKLLTQFDEIIKRKLARKFRPPMTKKQYEFKLQKLKNQLNGGCNHPCILFVEKDLAFRCAKCNEKLIKVSSMKEFNLFCLFSEIDPKSLIL